MTHCCHGLLILLIGFAQLVPVGAVRADAEFELSPIVLDSSPGEVLQHDPVLPVQTDETQKTAGSGNVASTLTQELPLPVSDTGTPGSLAQLRGLGRSAEDMNILVFGIPLNPPQGGGFNLSPFPQFLWSRYRFQLGPSLHSTDPRALAGTLSLVPWTVEALSARSQPLVRGTLFYSSDRVRQASVATSSNGVAVVAGYSQGELEGASGAFSAQKKLDSARIRFHLLATDVDALSRSDFSHLKTTRVIPVLQADFDLADKNLLKTSVFYDSTYQRYKGGYPTQDRISQVGTENAIFLREWELGVSGRTAKVDGSDFDPPTESILNLHLRRSFRTKLFLIDPVVQGVGVEGYGFFPQVSLGARQALEDSRQTIFARVSYSRRIPSLQDRYYRVPGFFVGNPELEPETDWTAILGTDFDRGPISVTVQGLLQWRQDAHSRITLPGSDSVANIGSAHVYSGMVQLTYRATSWFDVQSDLTLSESEVSGTGEDFPFLPGAINLLSFNVHEPKDREWELQLTLRNSGRFSVGSGGSLPGYGFVDFEAQWNITRSIQLGGQIENIFDRPIETFPGDVKLNRSFSFLVSGTF